MTKPLINKTLFWDVDPDNINWEKNSINVIERVFDYGSLEDIRKIIAFYGLLRVKKDIVHAKSLSNKSLNLASMLLDIPITSFKCYIKKQLNPVAFDY